MRILFTIPLAAGLLLGSLSAAELRTWTSRKGSNLEAQLVSVEGGKVKLLTADTREIELKAEDLSLADRQYLVEFGQADPEVIESGEIGEPELEARIDRKTFKDLEKLLVVGEAEDITFKLLETEHFLIASNDVRPEPMAETAERMWHGMAFEHMNFRADWGDKKRLIMLIEDPEVFTAIGLWYRKTLEARSVGPEVLMRISQTWEQVGSTGITLPLDLAAEWNLHSRATVFNIKDDSAFKKEMKPYPVHVMASDLMGQQMGGVSDFGSTGYFAVLTGYSYFKEIKLAGETTTRLIDAQGSDFSDITSKRGFEDGTSWAKTLRTLVRRGKVKPDLTTMLGWKAADLDPEKLVLIYSFAYYCNSTPERLAGFARMVRRVESSDQIPVPIEFARLMGFESVEALENDWIEFVSSTKFK